MKILVDADELHKVFMQSVKLKEQLEENDKRRDIAYYITKTLGSMWFQGTRAYAEDIEDSINQPMERLNNIMQELKEAALDWKPAPEGSISDINNEDREWADKHIMLKEFTTFINKAKQTHPKIAGARINCVNNKNGFNPATMWLTDYVEIKEYVKGFIEGNNSGGKIKSINVEIVTDYAAKELHLKLKGE
jgi:hypothetical protein